MYHAHLCQQSKWQRFVETLRVSAASTDKPSHAGRSQPGDQNDNVDVNLYSNSPPPLSPPNPQKRTTWKIAWHRLGVIEGVERISRVVKSSNIYTVGRYHMSRSVAKMTPSLYWLPLCLPLQDEGTSPAAAASSKCKTCGADLSSAPWG